MFAEVGELIGWRCGTERKGSVAGLQACVGIIDPGVVLALRRR